MTYDPIPAQGVGAERFDQPSLFYLTNRAIIDEWHDLRSNVAEAVGEWCRSALRDALEGPALERGLRVAEARGPGTYHHIVVCDPRTPVNGTKPVIGIGLAWPSKTVDPSNASMFVGVRASRNKTGKLAAAKLLDAGGREYRAADKTLHGTDDSAWPIFRYISAGEEWWTDLDQLRDDVVRGILELADGLREPLMAASTVEVVTGDDEDG